MMFRRPGLTVATLVFAVLAAPLPLEAQPGKTPGLGLLMPGSSALASSSRAMEALREGLRGLGWVEGRTPEEFDRAFSQIKSWGAHALLVPGDVATSLHRTRIVELATRQRLPTMFGGRDSVNDGGLMAYGASLIDQYRRAAAYVDKVLRGAKPADLPVEQPTKFDLVVNLKTAKALGLTIPPSVLLRADGIIQ